MKKNIFLIIAIVAIMASALVGCTGKNKPSTSSGGNNATPQRGGNVYDPKDHFAAVPVDIDFVENWMLPTDGVITEVELENTGLGIYRIRVQGITTAQCDNYISTLESKGMAKGFDKCVNADVVIDFTKTFLKDKPEESELTLRIYEK